MNIQLLKNCNFFSLFLDGQKCGVLFKSLSSLSLSKNKINDVSKSFDRLHLLLVCDSNNELMFDCVACLSSH